MTQDTVKCPANRRRRRGDRFCRDHSERLRVFMRNGNVSPYSPALPVVVKSAIAVGAILGCPFSPASVLAPALGVVLLCLLCPQWASPAPLSQTSQPPGRRIACPT